ncbi:hypothetical protein NL364_29300, partial [Klebsiella pneumoniae]|nr:hypothetical protein [Klebsiella pneumoniae]
LDTDDHRLDFQQLIDEFTTFSLRMRSFPFSSTSSVQALNEMNRIQPTYAFAQPQSPAEGMIELFCGGTAMDAAQFRRRHDRSLPALG